MDSSSFNMNRLDHNREISFNPPNKGHPINLSIDGNNLNILIETKKGNSTLSIPMLKYNENTPPPSNWEKYTIVDLSSNKRTDLYLNPEDKVDQMNLFTAVNTKPQRDLKSINEEFQKEKEEDLLNENKSIENKNTSIESTDKIQKSASKTKFVFKEKVMDKESQHRNENPIKSALRKTDIGERPSANREEKRVNIKASSTYRFATKKDSSSNIPTLREAEIDTVMTSREEDSNPKVKSTLFQRPENERILDTVEKEGGRCLVSRHR